MIEPKIEKIYLAQYKGTLLKSHKGKWLFSKVHHIRTLVDQKNRYNSEKIDATKVIIFEYGVHIQKSYKLEPPKELTFDLSVVDKDTKASVETILKVMSDSVIPTQDSVRRNRARMLTCGAIDEACGDKDCVGCREYEPLDTTRYEED